jgi:hypothetical protein
MWQLNPDRCRMEVETRYRGSRSHSLVRVATWRIKVEELPLTIVTRTAEDMQPEDRELLAQHIASAIGWRLGYAKVTRLSEAA